MASIKVENLKKYFGKVKAVDDISFEVKNGEFMALLGPSGCGKTTTLLTLAGIYKPTSGKIFFGDYLVNDVQPRDRNIGMVFQSYALYPHMSVYDNISFPLKAKGSKKKEFHDRVVDIAEKLGIGHLLDRKPSEISGGQQQRVALARALIKEPQIFLLDEPLSNLDARLRVMMRAEIKKLQNDLGITTVYVTHDQVEALTMADRIAVFSNGKIMQIGDPEKIYNRPQNLFVAQFIGNPPMNFAEAEIKEVEGVTFAISENLKIRIDDTLKPYLKNLNSPNVIVGIRPEDIKIYKNKELNMDLTEGILYVIEPLGRDEIYNVKVGESLLKVITEEKLKIGVGEKVYCEFDAKKLHIFDRESEISIRR